MLTTESAITDAPTLLGLAVVETTEPPDMVATGVTMGDVLAIKCLTVASKSPISFLGDSYSLVIMGVCLGLITFPDRR